MVSRQSSEFAKRYQVSRDFQTRMWQRDASLALGGGAGQLDSCFGYLPAQPSPSAQPVREPQVPWPCRILEQLTSHGARVDSKCG
jgi:hypothetical protein